MGNLSSSCASSSGELPPKSNPGQTQESGEEQQFHDDQIAANQNNVNQIAANQNNVNQIDALF